MEKVLIGDGKMEKQEQKHTPGPWEAKNIGDKIIVRKADSGINVCVMSPEPSISKKEAVGPRWAAFTREEWTANISLLTAAPDLLDALREAVTTIRRENWHDRVWEQAQATIAKATNQEAAQ